MDEAHSTHAGHDHTHGARCGHQSIDHDGHTDYLHDGHLHRMHGDHVDEHSLEAGPSACTPGHGGDHEAAHRHTASCGHEQVPHGDHVDYVVEGHLHRPHEGHCDVHGDVRLM